MGAGLDGLYRPPPHPRPTHGKSVWGLALGVSWLDTGRMGEGACGPSNETVTNRVASNSRHGCSYSSGGQRPKGAPPANFKVMGLGFVRVLRGRVCVLASATSWGLHASLGW